MEGARIEHWRVNLWEERSRDPWFNLAVQCQVILPVWSRLWWWETIWWCWWRLLRRKEVGEMIGSGEIWIVQGEYA